MAATNAAKRLRKEHMLLEREPEFGIWATPGEKDVLRWEFVMLGSDDTPYEGGLYHGRLHFPTTFPMAPPGITMITPSGRFETNKKICMSMSDFHPELWNPTWSVRTILVGLVSFMNSEENTTGGLMNVSAADRVGFAKRSLGSCLAATGPSAAAGVKLADAFPELLSLSQARAGGSWPPPRLPPLPPSAGQLKAAAEARAAAEEQRTVVDKMAEVAVSSSSEEPAKVPLSKGQKKKEKERRKKEAAAAQAEASAASECATASGDV